MAENTDKASDQIKTATAKSDSSTALHDDVRSALESNTATSVPDLKAVATRMEADKTLPTLALDRKTVDGLFTGAQQEDPKDKDKTQVSKKELDDYANDPTKDAANRLLAQAMSDRFAQIDTSGDGQLSREELAKWATDKGGAAPVPQGDNTGKPEIKKDANNRITEVKGPDGTTTNYEYDENGKIKTVTRSGEYDKQVYTVTKRDANGNPIEYTVQDYGRDKDHGPYEKAGDARTVKGSLSHDDVGTTVATDDAKQTTTFFYANGDKTVEGKDFTTQYKTDGKGNLVSVETQRGTYDDNGRFIPGNGPSEKLTKDGDKWIRNGNPNDVVTNVYPSGDGGYTYEHQEHGQKQKVTQRGDGSRSESTDALNGKNRTVEYDQHGNVKSIVTKFGDSGVSETLTFGSDGKPQLKVDLGPNNPGEGEARPENVTYDPKTGAYSYTEGDLMVRQMADGTRMRGPKPADGKVDSFKPTTVEKSTGDVFEFKYDKDGNVESVKQSWPKGDYTQGGKPREPETWTKGEDGEFHRSSDGMPAHDLKVDKDGNFSYTYPDGKGHAIRHTDTPDGGVKDEVVKPPAGDQQFGNRKFHVNEDGSMTYDIESGDTLWSMSMDILQARGLSPSEISNADIVRMYTEIAKLNGISDPNKIYAGTKGLKIPA